MIPDIGLGSLRNASPGRVVQGVSGRENHRVRVDATGAVGQISTITIGGGTDTETYSARFQATGLDETVSFVATASTAANVRDGLEAAIAANERLMAFIDELNVGTGTILVEAVEGVTFVVSFPANPSTHLSVAYTAAASAPQYIFGRAAEVVASGTELAGGIREATAIDGAEIALAITHNSTDAFSATFIVDGEAKVVTWTGGANADATDTAAKAAFDAEDWVGSCVINSTGDVDVFGLPGQKVSIVSSSAGGSAVLAVTLTSAADALPTFCLVCDDRATPMLDSFPQTQPVGPLPGTGVLTADPSGSTTYATEAPGSSITGTDVYVETAAGANLGRLYDTPSTTRTPWPEAKWVGLDANDPTLAAFEL